MHAETHARTTPPSSLLPPQSFSFLLSFSNLHPLPLQHVEKLVTVLGMGWGRGRGKGGVRYSTSMYVLDFFFLPIFKTLRCVHSCIKSPGTLTQFCHATCLISTTTEGAQSRNAITRSRTFQFLFFTSNSGRGRQKSGKFEAFLSDHSV